jgi:EF-hand domain pair
VKTSEHLIDPTLKQRVLEKIANQWKTLRKAFMDLNSEKTGSIKPHELKFFLNHWGMQITEANFNHLFS